MLSIRQRLVDLLVMGGFQYRADPPFVLASGRTSPMYLDCKRALLSHEGLALVGRLGYAKVRALGVTAVGGLTLGADPVAMAIAHHSHGRAHGLDAFVVRKEPKGHGTSRWVEGHLAPTSRVAVVDDVVTTGGSTLIAIARLREAQHHVDHAFAVVDRGEGGREALTAVGVTLHALVQLDEILERACALGRAPATASSRPTSLHRP
jgi:orotate phosphoribosyltransferase